MEDQTTLPLAPVPAKAQTVQAVRLSFVGTPGGVFNISGVGFGNRQSGTAMLPGKVTVGGRDVQLTSWRDHLIKGVLPRDIQSGDVIVTGPTGTFKTSFKR